MGADSLFGLLVVLWLACGVGAVVLRQRRHARRWDGIKRDRRNYWGRDA